MDKTVKYFTNSWQSSKGQTSGFLNELSIDKRKTGGRDL